MQFADLEIAKDSYFSKLTPTKVAYNSSDKSYTIIDTACIKTLAKDFTKLTFDTAEDYAYYEINDKEFLVANDADDINVVETNGNKFKIQDKEIDAEKIGRVIIDEQLTFSGTEINFDDVTTNYAQNKPVSYSFDGEEITTTGDAIYVVYGNSNGKIKVVPQGEEYADDDSEAAGKVYNFDKAGNYTVNGITFHAEANSTAQINRYNTNLIALTDGAIVKGSDVSKYNNRQFLVEGAVELIGKKFETDSQTRCGLLNIEDNLEIGTEKIPFTLTGFTVRDKYVVIQDDCYDSVKVVDRKLSSIEGLKASAEITGNGLSNVTILTTESGEFSIRGRQYKITGDIDGVTFVTGSHGNVIEINGLQGSVEGNFESEILVNGKAIRLPGASLIKVTSDGDNITEISNVAGDLVTADGNTYRKNVRVYELGGAEKLTTSAEGTIIFHGNKFETNAGKTFELDEDGNVFGLEKAQDETANESANVAEVETSASPLLLGETDEEDFSTINLSTTDGLEEVFGNFSAGLMTAADTFNINGKTFKTSAAKTIFKLDGDGNVCEIVTDSFYPDEKAYTIKGDFNDEIIFNGKKFCVTGTNDTSIFIGDEPLITINLAQNAVEVVESGGASEIAVTGGGDITVGDKTFSTADDFEGILQTNSIEKFVRTISGELGGIEIGGITIDSEDSFSMTGDGEKVSAIENLQNGSLTSDNLDTITINGEKISVDDSEEVTLTITDGELKSAAETVDSGTTAEEILESLGVDNPITVNADNRNVTLSGGQAVVVEDTSAKVSITAGDDTIVSQGENVHVNLNKGGNTWLFATGGKMTLEGYDDTTGAGFNNHYDDMLPEILNKISSKEITFDKGKLSIDSAVVSFGDVTSEIVNFYDANGGLQKIGFASDDATINANKKKENLILVGGIASTLLGGAGNDSIFADAGSYVDAGAGKNYVELETRNASDDGAIINIIKGSNTIANFNAGFDDSSDVIENSSKYWDNKFDGTDIIIRSDGGKAVISNVGSGEDFVQFKQSANGYEYKVALAQKSYTARTGKPLSATLERLTLRLPPAKIL